MPERYGTNEAVFDALRNLTLAFGGGGQAGSGEPPPGSGGNKIILFRTDGSPLIAYEPTQTGLATALAAAVSGDTVWLPSIAIAMTAGVTVPSGVTLRGLSDNAILSFSGFSGAAITLAAGAALILCTVVMVATGTTAIGVDNSAADTVMIHVKAQASGGTATNIAIGSGAVIAREIWQLHLKIGLGFSLTWSSTYGFADAVNDTTWNLINTWPAGFDVGTFNNYSAFAMPPDGSEFYITSSGKIWRCTNVPAIRAAPATTPTYEVIADSSIMLGASALDGVNGIFYWNDRLCTVATNASTKWYGEYSGGVWAWVDTELGGASGMTFTGERWMAPTGIELNLSTLANALTNGVIIQWDAGFGAGNSQPLWRRFDSTRVITVKRISGINTFISNDAGDSLHDTGILNKEAFHVGGSLYGASASVVMIDGETFAAADGATFTDGPTLGRGAILDVYYTGGGAWVWAGQPNYSDPVAKISLDGGATYADKTGDFWTVFGTAALGIELHGVHLVF